MKIRNIFSALFVAFTVVSCVPASKPVPTITARPPRSTPPLIATASRSECPTAKTPFEDTNLIVDQNGESIRMTILRYLNQGADPQAVSNAIISQAPTEMKLALEVIPLDLNGDGLDELVAKVQYALDDYPYGNSFISIFICYAGHYREAGHFASDEILSIEDLNGDDNPEIVTHWSWFGSGCLEFYSIVGWGGDQSDGKAIDYLDPKRLHQEAFPCRTELNISDSDQDGQKELIFTGSENIRHSIVPDRGFIYSYEVIDMQTYLRVSEEYTPSPSRVHVLAEAEQALSESPYGPFTHAIELYQKAANDEKLEDYPSSVYYYTFQNKESHSKEYTTAFSLFRLVTIFGGTSLSADELKTAETRQILRERYKEEEPGSEFIVLANLFVSEIEAGKSVSIACSVVSLHIEHEYPDLEKEFNWSPVLFYDNGTICPY